MTAPKMLCLSGSTRSNSFNTALAASVKKSLALANLPVTQISLADYPMPIYNADDEAESGQPDAAHKLHDLFCAHHGIFIASPEYNGSMTPLLKNTIDWISRIRRDGQSPFKRRVFAIGSATQGALGGIRGLIGLRQVLEVALGAHVLAEQVAVPRCSELIAENGDITDERVAGIMKNTMDRMIEMATYYAERP